VARASAKAKAKKKTVNRKADRELVITRTLDASRAAVFRAWTDPRQLAQWWGPEGFTAPTCNLDLRVGGAWRTCMRSPDGNEMWVGGVYREIESPQRLVFTWAWDGDDGNPGHESLVTAIFKVSGGRTQLRVAHRLLESKKSRDLHKQGWGSTLNALATYLTSISSR